MVLINKFFNKIVNCSGRVYATFLVITVNQFNYSVVIIMCFLNKVNILISNIFNYKNYKSQRGCFSIIPKFSLKLQGFSLLIFFINSIFMFEKGSY